MADEAFGEDAAVAVLRREGDTVWPLRSLAYHLAKGVFPLTRVGAHVGDFDADGAGVGSGGVPGALFEVERLVKGAIKVEHEMDAQVAAVVEGFKALAADAGDIEMDDELVHDALQEREVPAAAADALDFGVGQAAGAQVIRLGMVRSLISAREVSQSDLSMGLKRRSTR